MAASTSLQLGMVGLGRMGANLVRRAMRDGHRCVGTDVSVDAIRALEGEGMAGAASAGELVEALEAPRTVWVMVPAGTITERAIAELGSLLEPGDTVIDGGNTRYHDDIRRARELSDRGIHYLDVGTSGGVFGLERGFCLMIGGENGIVARLAPLFTSLAPGLGSAERTPGRSGDPASRSSRRRGGRGNRHWCPDRWRHRRGGCGRAAGRGTGVAGAVQPWCGRTLAATQRDGGQRRCGCRA